VVVINLARLDASARPRVNLLGPVTVQVRGGEAEISGAKPRLLLCLLALQAGRVVSVEHLIDGMWGDDPPATARKALQVHVSTLRRLVGESAIRTERGGYRLDALVDVGEFEAALELARREVSADPAKALSNYEGALKLWRDLPFADLSDEDALAPERARLEELRLGAVERRIEALLALGRHREVLGDLETLTVDHPYREKLRGLQMLALYRAGRQAEALRAFRVAGERLAEDLGIDPSPELRALEQRILEQDPSLDAPVAAATKAINSTLPARRTDLVGRDADVETLLGLLASSRLVTLTGVGGCGKTRLAIEVAHQAIAEYAGGAYFVDLTRVTDDEAVLPAVAAGTGLEMSASSDLAELVTQLRPRQALLVVDNCEHVLDGVADVLDVLLERCPDVSVLATSREAIAIGGELPWRVPSLDVGNAGSSAVELFVRRAREADTSFRMSEQETADVVDICRRLDGIPLALELAAARTKTMTVAEIRRRLDDRFRLLSGGRRRAAQRQQTLQGAVEWGYGLLTDDEKTMLRRLSVFQGGFDLGDVPAVTGFTEADSVDLVDSLVAKSLVDVSWSRGSIARRRLLETIRLFALEKLIAEDEAALTRERHYETFAGRLHGKSAWEMERSAALRERSERELDNFIAAIDWARDTGRAKEAALTTARMNGPLFWTGALPRYRDLLEGDYDLEPTEEAILLVGRTSLLHSGDERAEAARLLSERARSIQTDEPVPDLVFTRLAEFDFAPVQGAAERLAVLDQMMSETDSSTPLAYLAEIEIRRAGQLFSLARLEETLASSRRAFEWTLAEGTTSVYWAATATISLLVVLDRREEADEVLDLVRNRSDVGKMTGFVDAPILDILTALTQVGAGNPRVAGKALAQSAAEYLAGKGPLQDGDYLVLFAAFRSEIGDQVRADELIEAAPVKNGHINWLVWPYVWRWQRGQFEERNDERRRWELARMDHASALRPLLPRYIAEEIEFWTG